MRSATAKSKRKMLYFESAAGRLDVPMTSRLRGIPKRVEFQRISKIVETAVRSANR